jgi:hypothetical protein
LSSRYSPCADGESEDERMMKDLLFFLEAEVEAE